MANEYKVHPDVKIPIKDSGSDETEDDAAAAKMSEAASSELPTTVLCGLAKLRSVSKKVSS